MACETFITLGVNHKQSNSAIEMFSRTYFNSQITTLQASLGCATVIGLIPDFATDPGTQGVIEDGTTFNKTIFTFDLTSDTYKYDLVIDGTGYGNWTVVGGVLTDNTTYGATFTMGPLPGQIDDFAILVNISLSTASGDFPNAITAFNTATDYVGCVIPACAVAPPAAGPSLGSGVKCANFSKIFNPLGIPLRSK